MRTLRRILALWRVQVYLDFLFMTRNISSFLGYLISDTILVLGSVATTLLLAERFDGIGPWTKPQVLFLLGYAMIANDVTFVFFGFNIKFISRRLGRGQLDHTLLQPQPLWLSLLTEGFMPLSSTPPLLPGVALLVWGLASGAADAVATTPGWWALLALNLTASATIILAYSVLWGSLAFWAPRAAEEISTSALRLVNQLKPFPLDGIGTGLLAGLLTALPVGFVAWFPCRVLLGLDPSPVALALTPLAALLIGGLAALAFTRGLHHYALTGASRYLDRGHRR